MTGRPVVALGLLLVAAGVFACVLGCAWSVFAGRGFPRLLPGDIVIERPGFAFVFPLGTSLAASALLTFLLWVILRR
jgi:hypothetical protein